MQRQLSDPLRVYLSQPGTAPSQQQAEMVEASSTLRNIMGLLTTRHLTTRPFPSDPSAAAAGEAKSTSAAADCSSCNSTGSVVLPSCVVVKRQDGSCCSRVHVTEGCTVQELVETVEQVEVSPLEW